MQGVPGGSFPLPQPLTELSLAIPPPTSFQVSRSFVSYLFTVVVDLLRSYRSSLSTCVNTQLLISLSLPNVQGPFVVVDDWLKLISKIDIPDDYESEYRVCVE